MDTTIGINFLKNYKEEAFPFLDKFLSDEITRNGDLGPIPKDMLETLKDISQRGKGIRGALCMLAYRACFGDDVQEALKTSVFIELLHYALLIQDDFMDRDDSRRGLKSVHLQYADKAANYGVKIPKDHYGISMATCVSDAALYLSWKMLMASKLPQTNVMIAAGYYSDYVYRIALGQALDLTYTGSKNPKEKDILNILWLKSGEYTALFPLMVGCALAGEKDEDRLAVFKKYAECFGWAFQIQDDVLGMFGNPDKTGKPVGSDLREGKNTLLMLHLREHGTPEQRRFLESKLGNPDVTDADVAKMQGVLKESGSYDHVVQQGWDYVNTGLKLVPELADDQELGEVFKALLYFMMDRTK